MSPRRAFIQWAAIGVVTSSLLLYAQVGAVGGLEGLLHVGEVSALRPLIESELGPVPTVPGGGHDSQIFYAIGLDLRGNDVPPLLDHGGYRYRRILLPGLASGLGLLGGQPLLWGMIILAVASTGVAAGAVAATARMTGVSDWAALAVILNPGVWLGVRLLTSDPLALALMTVGLLAVAARSKAAPWVFALSGLAKEAILLTPGILSLTDFRKRWRLAVVPSVVLAAWGAWVTLNIQNGFTGRGNFDWPFAGLIEASGNWVTSDSADQIYVIFTLALVLVGLVWSLVRSSWLKWPLLAWSVLGLVSSAWVWDFGNNAARAFAPILVLLALSFGSPPAIDTDQPVPTISRKNLPV